MTIFRDLGETLVSQPFFDGFNQEQVEFLVGCSANRVFKQDEYLFREGAAANSLYLIREGKVAIETASPSGGALTLATAGRGDMLGWSWIVPPYLHRSDCRALEQTRTVAIDAVCLRDKLETDQSLGFKLLTRVVEVMAQRMSSTRLQLLDLYANDPN